MALGASGAMRMGADVNVELGSASTTQISLGQASVRTLTGIASGAVMFPTNFYGKSNEPVNTIGLFYGGYSFGSYLNRTTRLNACGALSAGCTNVGTARSGLAGAKVGSNGLFYGGEAFDEAMGFNMFTNAITRINTCGALVGSQTGGGSSRQNLAGATVGSNGLFYGGLSSFWENTITRIDSSGATVGSQTTVGTGRSGLGGATVGSNGLFYGGEAFLSGCIILTNVITRINSSGAIVGSETTAGTSRQNLAGATVGSNGLFYGGESSIFENKVTRINACGALVGSETTAGTARTKLAGATVGSNGLFFGGQAYQGPSGVVSKSTRINACGALVGSENDLMTIQPRSGSAGAGL